MADQKQSKLQQEQKKLQKPLGLKRPLSWLAFWPILFAFLLLPLLAMLKPGLFDVFEQAETPLEQATITKQLPLNAHPSLQAVDSSEPGQTRTTAMALDSVWNPGPLASPHSNLEGNCQACHAGDFSRVKDETCLVCHSNMGLHVKTADLPNMDFEEGRCASCHRDHKGRESLAEQNKHFVGQDCAACHQQIDTVAPNTETLPVADFTGKKHPAFRITVAASAEPSDLRRVRMMADQAVIEATSLKFPHDVHLDPKGIDSPSKKVVMECSNCHETANTPTSFKPISMENHCQECHTLSFEPALPERQVPHGSVQEALSTVEEFYSYLALNPEERNRVNAQRAVLSARPGDEGNRSNLRKLSGSPRAQAQFAARELFEKTACAVCHEVTPVEGKGNSKTSGSNMPQYAIAPIAPAHPWMPMAKFDHKAHAFDSCESCHKASESEEASDVLMPAIEGCQTCHAGSKPVINKVQSDCGVCHEYHLHNPMQTQLESANVRTKTIEQHAKKN